MAFRIGRAAIPLAAGTAGRAGSTTRPGSLIAVASSRQPYLELARRGSESAPYRGALGSRPYVHPPVALFSRATFLHWLRLNGTLGVAPPLDHRRLTPFLHPFSRLVSFTFIGDVARRSLGGSLRKAAAWLLAACAAGPLHAESTTSVPTTAGSGVTMRIATPVSVLPRFGFLPIRVLIDNHSERAGTWQIRFEGGESASASGAIKSRMTVTAAAGEKKEAWFFVPLAEAAPSFTLGATPPPPAATNAAIRGRTPTLATIGASTTTAGVETRARTKLIVGVPAASGAGGWKWTSRLEPGNRPGENIGIATALQSISFNESPLTGKDLPLGFDVVDRIDPVTRWAERHFIYKETLPDPSGESAPKSSAFSTLSSSLTAESAARAALEASGLLQAPSGVTQTVSVSPLYSGRSGGQVAWLTTFIQTGSSRVLPVQSGLAVPPGTVINLHASAQPGEVVRSVTFVEPDALVGLEGKSAPGTATDPEVAAAAAQSILMRYGYLRPQPDVEVSRTLPGQSNFTLPALHAGATLWFESGPKALLPAPIFGTLPPNTVAYLLSGPTPDQVIRCFAVGPPVKFAAPSTAAGGASGGAAAALSIQVTGPGILGAADVSFAGLIPATASLAPPLAITQPLTAKFRQILYNGSLRGLPNLNAVDTVSLPADWRMWSPFHGVLVTQAEYESLDAARRAALRSWVMQGGFLFLEPTVTGPLVGVPLQQSRLGNGMITTLPWTVDDYLAPPVINEAGTEYVKVAKPEELIPLLQLHALALSLPAGDSLRPAPLSKETPRRGVTVADKGRWAVGILVGFAILAGPLNLLRLAPSGRRHRLFFTTPLLAFVFTACLGGVVVGSGGFGGDGDRHAVVVLLPSEGRAVVYQDQVSTTGMLGRRTFALDDRTLLTNLAVDEYDSTGRSSYFERENGTAGGDWFRNHWGTAQHLRQVSAARGGVAVKPALGLIAPSVESSLPAKLQDFYYLDLRSQAWTAAEVAPGKPVTLTRATVTQWPPVNPTGSKYLETVLAGAARIEPGRWIARSGGSSFAPIETFKAIAWHDTVVYTGVAGDRLPEVIAPGEAPNE